MSDQEAIIAKLSEYDFVVVIDKSGSMGEDDIKGDKTRWEYMQETAVAFTRDICKIDTDGISVVVFSGTSVQSYENCDVNKVKDIFANSRPGGSTPLTEALQEAFKLAGKSDKKDFIVVFTDGVPDDKKGAAAAIVKQANSQTNDDDCTVLFVQVGYDKAASEYLRKLDDDLSQAKFDIVDVKTQEEVENFSSTAELIVAAIND